MEEFWLARDRSGDLYMHEKVPLKNELTGEWILGGQFELLPAHLFSEVQWEDKGPTKCKIELTKNEF